MIEEGEGAPGFELPAVVGGEIEHVGLADYLGSNVIILAFYPADFNPACDGTETDLDELDLFTMQKDVAILGISGDSVYSHRAFADEYDLKVPLLADIDGDVAESYGVAVDDPEAGYRTERAVVVVTPGGDVEFAWSTDDLRELPPVDRVREAVDDVGGNETAVARYRVGHAHYVEGRRAFTSAMKGFSEDEWMMAQSDFIRAFEEFEDAQSQFNTAARFGEDEDAIAHFERAEDKAELLWQAAEWLAESASAYASGEGAEGRSMRQDAESPLEEARRYGEPLEPDDFPPEGPPPPLEGHEDEEEETFLPDDEEEVDASLEVDLDEEAHTDDDLRESVEGQETAAAAAGEGAGEDSTGVDGDGGGWEGKSVPEAEAAPEDEIGAAPSDAAGSDGDGGDAGAAGEDEEDDAEDDEEEEIGEAELEEITAELEQQTEAAEAEHEREQAAAAEDESAESTDEAVADDRGGEDETVDVRDGDEIEASDGGTEGGGERDDDLELDLTDPTEGEGLDPLEDEDEEDEDDAASAEGDDDLGDGGHGVPDSL